MRSCAEGRQLRLRCRIIGLWRLSALWWKGVSGLMGSFRAIFWGRFCLGIAGVRGDFWIYWGRFFRRLALKGVRIY